MSTQINAYLTFPGNCREAMNFYKDCLGGELLLSTIGESATAQPMPGTDPSLIMHAALKHNAIVLMASDNIMKPNEKIQIGDGITLSLNCSSQTEIETYFAKLSAGGKVDMPLQDTFWGAAFGMLTDKYGMPWMLNFHKNQK